MSVTVPAVISSLCGSLVLTLVYWYLYSQDRKRYIKIWAAGWTVYSTRFIFDILLYLVTDAAIILAVQLLVNLISGVLILRGTLLFLNKPLAKWWIYCSALFAGWEIAAFLAQMPAFALNLPAFLFVGLIYIYTGYAFLKAGETEGLGRLFAGWGFIVWGIHKMNYAFLNGIAELAFWGYIASALLESAVACGTLLAYFQKIHRDLSNNERRFRLMAENARDIIYRFRLKPSRCFEYISPSSLAVTGYTPEEHYKNPDLIFWRFAQERFSINMVTKFIASGKGPLRMRMWHKDGRVVYTEHRIVPIYEEGSLAGFEGIARDITEIKQTEDALRESGRRFRDMLENVHLATVTIDEQGKIVYCNQYLLRLSGWSMAELIGRDLFETLIPKDKRSFHRRKLTDRIKNNTPDLERFEREIVARDGQTHIISWNTSLLRDADGRAVGISSIGEDISERKKSEGILKRYQLLSEHAWDIMLFLSREGRILEANNAALKAYGYSRDEILTKTMSDLRIPDEIESIEAALSEAETQGSLFEAVHRRRDGTTFPVEVSLQGAFIGEARVLLAVMRDITDRKRAEETINHLAYHDPLTDLPNRILFYDRLTVAIATARRNGHKLAVMFLDLDRFKYVNDMMGHAVGDQLLNDVACQLLNHVRKNDTVARMGGDEFTILLPEISHEEDAAKVAGNLIKILKKPWIANNSEVLITASIGIALFPNDGEDAETLTANADTAMYRAKEEGNSYQFYTSAMNFKTKERMKMENALKRAVEAKEFEVYYQPQFDTVAGRIVGVEALLRWRHPEKGLILPGEFISLAEDIGLIIPIGELVLRTACRQVKAWEAEGLTPIRLAVNLSAKQFRQKKLVQTIANVLQETGLEPSLLELEITETTAMQDIDFSVTVLKQFREMGINIAIDDFGTGYSSLNYLRRFPINKLKIDHSFVRDVLTDVDAAAIAATIIVLAQNMKLKVIIEGVETKEQLAFFSQQECHVLQGYLFSEPAPADEIAALLQKAKLQ